jgi:hypothetical protein
MTASIYENLEALYKQSYSNIAPFIFLHPDDERDYTAVELYNLRRRDFITRWLICCTSIGGKCVALRTHFTDNHKFESHLKYVRNYYKATVTNNPTAAKIAATELLSMFFNLEPSQYYSFAVTMASGLSNYGSNTRFELGNKLLVPDEEGVARMKLCLLMNILFSKVSMYRFLIRDSGINTYRLVYCRVANSSNKQPYLYAIFSFLIQLCLTGYVIAEIASTGLKEWRYENIPLAILTLIYSTMIAYPEFRESRDAMKLYGKTGFIQTLDFFVNKYLTMILLVAGFMVIMIQESFIEAVLNSTALMFVPEIDDQIPRLLGLEEDAIIKNYLTHQSLQEYDQISRMEGKRLNSEIVKPQNECMGAQFQDYHLTNSPEEPSSPQSGITFTPYQIQPTSEIGGAAYHIDPSNFVTERCLIHKLAWRYTTSSRFKNTSRPRIGYLRIELLIGGETIEISRQQYDDDIGVSDVEYELTGVFIITTFQMSNDITRLRVCGSPTALEFVNSFQYYSLWGLTQNAMNKLQRQIIREKKMKKRRKLRNLSDMEGFNVNDAYDEEDPDYREKLKYIRLGAGMTVARSSIHANRSLRSFM